jgi:hypothetical protein
MSSVLADRYAAVLVAIEQAELAAGRAPGSAKLLAASKRQPAAVIAQLHVLGQQDFAENYWQEAVEKQAQLSNQAITWHFIGRLQRRKAKAIAVHFSWVHTLTSEAVMEKLEQGRAASGLPPLQVCIQVNISADPDKDGVSPDEAAALCAAVHGSPSLQLRGLMTILRAGQSESAVLADYRRMAELLAALQAQGYDLDTLSMGMSADFPQAIAVGATWVRVGQALFGERNK